MITQPKPLPTANAPQEGFVLIVGLVILGLLTMLALSGMRDSTMQEKMAGASRDSGLASQASPFRPPSRHFVMRKTVLQAQPPDAPLMSPTMRIFLKTMRPFPNTTTYLMPLPGPPLTHRGIQPSLREFPPKGKAMPQTGSITSSAKQAPSLATVVLRIKLLWRETTWRPAPETQALRRPKPSMKSRHAVRAKVARVNQSCAFTIETEYPLQSRGLR